MPKAKAKKKSAKKKALAATVIILLIAVAVFAGAWTGFLPNPFVPSAGENSDGENGGSGGGGSGGTSGSEPYIPPAGTGYIQLSIAPDTVNREGSTFVVVSSNFRNVPFTFEAQYNGHTEWLTVTSGNVDNSGECSFSYQCDEAGEWTIRARHLGSGVVSNLVPLTVQGITLYQQKSVWNVGEAYTAALTGTYKNWLVSIWQKDETDDMWFWALNSLTDANGFIDYGVNSAVIDPAQTGLTKNVIAIISSTDPTGMDVVELFQQVEQTGIISDDDLNNFVNQGFIVKSNILTMSIS